MKWNAEAELRAAKEDLEQWDWGIEELEPLKKLCAHAGAIVLDQLNHDLNDGGALINFTEAGEVILWNLSGDHFKVEFNLTASIDEIVDAGDNLMDHEDKECLAGYLRQLADKLSPR